MTGLSASLACHPEMIPASTNPNLYQDRKAADDAIVQTVASYAVVWYCPVPPLGHSFYASLPRQHLLREPVHHGRFGGLVNSAP